MNCNADWIDTCTIFEPSNPAYLTVREACCVRQLHSLCKQELVVVSQSLWLFVQFLKLHPKLSGNGYTVLIVLSKTMVLQTYRNVGIVDDRVFSKDRG